MSTSPTGWRAPRDAKQQVCCPLRVRVPHRRRPLEAKPTPSPFACSLEPCAGSCQESGCSERLASPQPSSGTAAATARRLFTPLPSQSGGQQQQQQREQQQHLGALLWLQAALPPADILELPSGAGYLVIRRHGTHARAPRPAPYTTSLAQHPRAPPATSCACRTQRVAKMKLQMQMEQQQQRCIELLAAALTRERAAAPARASEMGHAQEAEEEEDTASSSPWSPPIHLPGRGSTVPMHPPQRPGWILQQNMPRPWACLVAEPAPAPLACSDGAAHRHPTVEHPVVAHCFSKFHTFLSASHFQPPGPSSQPLCVHSGWGFCPAPRLSLRVSLSPHISLSRLPNHLRSPPRHLQ